MSSERQRPGTAMLPYTPGGLNAWTIAKTYTPPGTANSPIPRAPKPPDDDRTLYLQEDWALQKRRAAAGTLRIPGVARGAWRAGCCALRHGAPDYAWQHGGRSLQGFVVVRHE